MRTRVRRFAATSLAVLTTLALAGCASGGDDSGDQGTAETEAADGAGYDDADTAGREGESGEEAAGGSSSDGDVLAIGAPLGRKVIRTAELELEVRDSTAAIERATRIAERAGGFVARADLSRYDGEQLVGTMTLRIPTERLGTTLTELEDLAVHVLAKRLGSDDVTEEYSDVEARLRNLRTLETELLDLLTEIRDQSDSADEILRVFERIRQVREEIEVLQGRKQVLDDLVDLATIDLRLVPASEAIPLADEGWSPGAAARDALRTTVGALQGLADAAIWVVLTALPILLLLGLPVAALLYAARRWRHRQVHSTR